MRELFNGKDDILSDPESLYSDDGLDDGSDKISSLPISEYVVCAQQIDMKDTITGIHLLIDAPDKTVVLVQTKSLCHWLQWDKIIRGFSSSGFLSDIDSSSEILVIGMNLFVLAKNQHVKLYQCCFSDQGCVTGVESLGHVNFEQPIDLHKRIGKFNVFLIDAFGATTAMHYRQQQLFRKDLGRVGLVEDIFADDDIVDLIARQKGHLSDKTKFTLYQVNCANAQKDNFLWEYMCDVPVQTVAIFKNHVVFFTTNNVFDLIDKKTKEKLYTHKIASHTNMPIPAISADPMRNLIFVAETNVLRGFAIKSGEIRAIFVNYAPNQSCDNPHDLQIRRTEVAVSHNMSHYMGRGIITVSLQKNQSYSLTCLSASHHFLASTAMLIARGVTLLSDASFPHRLVLKINDSELNQTINYGFFMLLIEASIVQRTNHATNASSSPLHRFFMHSLFERRLLGQLGVSGYLFSSDSHDFVSESSIMTLNS